MFSILLLITSEERQFARARTIDEYDVTMLVRVKSQINCDDATMLRQKKNVLGDDGKMSDRWLF